MCLPMYCAASLESVVGSTKNNCIENRASTVISIFTGLPMHVS